MSVILVSGQHRYHGDAHGSAITASIVHSRIPTATEDHTGVFSLSPALESFPAQRRFPDVEALAISFRQPR